MERETQFIVERETQFIVERDTIYSGERHTFMTTICNCDILEPFTRINRICTFHWFEKKRVCFESVGDKLCAHLAPVERSANFFLWNEWLRLEYRKCLSTPSSFWGTRHTSWTIWIKIINVFVSLSGLCLSWIIWPHLTCEIRSG